MFLLLCDDSALRHAYKQLSFSRYAYDGEDQCLSPHAPMHEVVSTMHHVYSLCALSHSSIGAQEDKKRRILEPSKGALVWVGYLLITRLPGTSQL